MQRYLIEHILNKESRSEINQNSFNILNKNGRITEPNAL
jgi:hypothetical protein